MAGLAMVVVTLMVVSSLASANPVAAAAHASKTLKAPYSGAPLLSAEWDSLGCGGSAHVPVGPSFNTTTGVLKGEVSASAKSCGSTNSTAVAAAAGGLLSTTTFTTSTGKYTLKVGWSVKFTLSLSASKGGSGQVAESFALLEGYAELYDAKNGSFILIGDNLSSFLNSSTPTVHTYSYKLAYSASLSLVAGNTYSVETFVEIVAYAFVTPGASTASVTANMGTSGDQAKLTSIVIP